MDQSAKYGNVYPTGLNGAMQVRFEQDQPHGRNGLRKRAHIDVDPQMIIGIAKYLAAGCVPGHAVWHYQNAHREFPCPGDMTCTTPAEGDVMLVSQTPIQKLRVGDTVFPYRCKEHDS